MIPIVLDLLGGQAWLRSFLPLVNRFGQSVPPLLAARRVKLMPRKKWGLAAWAGMMAFSFLALSGVWAVHGESKAWWLPLAFLALYGLFFVSTGINQICFNTLQGKLVPVHRRGRLLLSATFVGAFAAIGCILAFMPRWLTDDTARFDYIFGFAGLCFSGAAMLALLLKEPADSYEEPASRLLEKFTDVLRTLRSDAKFRRLCLIAALFGSSIMLFPHYQAIGRGERMGIGLRQIITWIVIQNIGAAFFSLLIGWIADSSGNRSVLRLMLFLLCGGPTLALGLSYIGPAAEPYFSIVFLLVGLTPVVNRVFWNYTLEMSHKEDHPRYLSAVTLCMSMPLFVSPLAGWVIDIAGFDVVFLILAAALFIGGLLTFTLHEPRND